MKVRAGGVGGRIVGTLFFSAFLAMGSVFTVLVARGAWNAIRTHSWDATTCRILDSGVAQDGAGGDYEFRTRYAYPAGGGTREGTVYKPGYAGSSSVSDAESLASRYPKDAQVPCYVSGSDPSEATLERPSLGVVFLVLFPLIFVAVGSGGIWMVWSAQSAESDAPRDAARRAISRKPGTPQQAAGCLAAFFGVFLLFGLGFELVFILPAWKVLKSQTWREVPCTVLSSAVRTHSGSDSNTYSVDILYEYEAGGRKHRSNRYEFLGGSSGGSAAKEAIVAANPPGTKRTCYVNPDNPNDAVMHRGFSKTYFVALVPLLFAGVGLGGIVWAWRMRRGGPRAPGDAASFAPAGAATRSIGPVQLKTTHPVLRFLGIVLLALFWNGIVSVFLWKMVGEWKSGGKPYFLTCFLVPFVIFGLLFVVGVFYQFLAIFNPRPSLAISASAIRLGGSADFSWTFKGSVSRLTSLRVVLEGSEEARYRRGTSTYTDRDVFARIPVYESHGAVMPAGNATVRVPADTMHSFTAPNNRIVWTLKLSGEIPKWPDVTEGVEIEVTPR